MIDRMWATNAIHQCIVKGVDHFFIAPGSRCTPLTLAVAQHLNAQVTQHFDERGLAFAALGYAQATGRPGVFICTSGTAVANALPAVVEASMERIPMLLFTADRPPELRHTGANQTIDQTHIYGRYARWFVDLPCPYETDDTGFLESTVARAIEESLQGPVHLNWMFREPFGLTDAPALAFSRKQESLTEAETSTTGSEIQVSKNTIIVAGGCRPHEARAIQQFATDHQMPLLTDITSGLREIPLDLAEHLPVPDTVLHFGGRIISKSWHQWTARLTETQFVHVTDRDLYVNPENLPQIRFVEPIDRIRLSVVEANAASFNSACDTVFTRYRKAVEQVMSELRTDSGAMNSEPEVAVAIGELIRDGHALFLGNSMPIRDFDRYAVWPANQDIVVGANRGASGIDGLIASSVGFAKGLNRPTTTVCGDLSCLHDLNSLALMTKSELPVTLVILNNHGGGIFDALPVANMKKYFEQYFITPHEFDFSQAAEMFGLPYVRVSDGSESPARDFASAYVEAVSQSESSVIEVATSRAHNQMVRQRIQECFRP